MRFGWRDLSCVAHPAPRGYHLFRLTTGSELADLDSGLAMFQKPGMGMMNSTAIWVLPMKVGPMRATRQSSSFPRLAGFRGG